jgi:hypothetical protein
MVLCDVAGSNSGRSRLLHCAFQATKSEKCQGNFFTVFHMQRGQEEGRRSPMLLLRQGRRQTGPPSWGCEFPGSTARDVLCSPQVALSGPREVDASHSGHLFLFCKHSREESGKSMSEQLLMLQPTHCCCAK